MQTPITADKISRTGGYNEVFWHVQGSIAPGTTFLLERQAESLSGPDGGWKTVAQGISRNSYFDLDVVPNHWYRYRVTPSQDSTTIFQPGEIRYFARPWVFLDARGHADGVQLVIRADPNVIPPNQVATVMRFDYEERYDTIFHPVLTHARFGGEYVIHVDDDDITSGTIYYYRLVLSHIIGDGVYDPVTFGVPDVAVMAGLIEPSRPSTPVAEEDANGIITLSWARPTDDNNRQALAYEIQSRRIKPPGVEVTWVPRGTTLRHSFTLHDGPPAFAYNNYRVMPLMMDGSRSAVGSPNLGHPASGAASLQSAERVRDHLDHDYSHVSRRDRESLCWHCHAQIV